MLNMSTIFLVLFFANIATFGLFAWDKHLAVYDMRRIPEWLLLFCSAVGGAFGAFCAMLMFRHKTKRAKFYIWVPMFLIAHIVIYIIIVFLT